MPGIYGFCGLDSASAESGIAAMSTAMYLYSHFRQDQVFRDAYVAASRVHLGKIGMTISPACDELNNGVWIEGEVYNLAEVVKEAGWAGGSVSNADFPKWILYAYRVNQLEAFLNRMDGYFCAALYDPYARKVLLISDRYGMRMLYWYHRNGVFAWSGEVKGILALPHVDRTIDKTSLPCFMDLGYLMGEHTWFEHISLIKPATILEYDIAANTVAHKYYWTWGEIKQSQLSFDDAVDALYEAFMTSVQRKFNPDERIGISLSGGLDSRAIFAAVNKLYPDYEGYAYTFGVPDCDDIEIAKQVVSRSRWRHEEFHFTSDNWFLPRIQMIWNTDGMQDMKHMHGGEFAAVVAKQIDVNLNGYLGDVVAGGGWINSMFMGKRATDKNLDDFYHRYCELSDIAAKYYTINSREPGLYMSRARRFTNMGTVNILVSLDQRKPFFGNVVLDLALSVPEQYRLRNSVYSVMLKRYYPSFFKDIPWQKTGKVVGLLKERTLPERAIAKVIRETRSLRLFLGAVGPKNYTDYAAWIREEPVSSYLSDLLRHSESVYCDYTDVDWHEEYLCPHLNNRTWDWSDKVLRAATIEIYLRRLFGGSFKDILHKT
ncbi:MAG: asparagine synthase-related protein [Candidatus Omnitrophota bacterium]